MMLIKALFPLLLFLPPLAAQKFDFAAAAQYSASKNGHSFLVMQGGKIVYEKYSNGFSSNKAHRLASGTKSFTGVLLAIAVDDGLLTFDEKLSKTLTEWKSDKRKSQITYRQLVGLVSGLYGGKTGSIQSYSASIKAPTIADPLKVFSYGPNPFQCFGEALKRKLQQKTPKETVTQYLLRKLIQPLGMTVSYWRNGSTGEPNLPSGAFLRAREWIKFGEMVRLGGILGNKRIVSSKNLAELFKPSKVKSNYGVGWWLSDRSSGLPEKLVFAAGAGTQRIYVLPELGLVIQRFAETTGRKFSDKALLKALLPSQYISFGGACRGSSGFPRLVGDSLSPPRVGGRLRLLLSGIPNRSPGLFYLGLSKTKYGGFPLPISLASLGMKGCSLYVSIDLPLAFLAQGGRKSLEIGIPIDDLLLGRSAFFQALIVDTKANSAGMSVSGAVEVRIGL
jgi:CubicO group peptidase (beta-lactamase class C family)